MPLPIAMLVLHLSGLLTCSLLSVISHLTTFELYIYIFFLLHPLVGCSRISYCSWSFSATDPCKLVTDRKTLHLLLTPKVFAITVNDILSPPTCLTCSGSFPSNFCMCEDWTMFINGEEKAMFSKISIYVWTGHNTKTGHNSKPECLNQLVK